MIIKFWRSNVNSMNYKLIKSAFVALTCTLFTHCDTVEKDKRPNIIVILADDMGYSDIGCYGGEIHTPNLDNLAVDGLRFTQFYNTSRCCPTRACLLSGLYPHQAGVGQMMVDRGLRGYQGNLSRHCVTIAEVLKTAGYDTYMSGKYHVTPYTPKNQDKSNWPLQRGFDKFYGTILGAGSYYDPASLSMNNEFISPYNDPEYKPETFYYTDAITEHATRFIRDHQDKNPFFLYVAYTAAHWPMQALDKDIKKYEGVYDVGYEAIRAQRVKRMKQLGLLPDDWQVSPKDGIPWSQVKNKEWEARCMQVYAAMVDDMDQGIGRIVAELKEKGELDNTLIFFLQDNGGCAESWGHHSREPIDTTITAEDIQTQMIPDVTRDNRPVLMGLDVMPGGANSFISYGLNWANVSNTPLRLYKHYVHEGGIATPLIVHWPDGIRAKNEWRQTPGHLIDLMATCVDVGKATYPTEFNGHKIIPMEGKSLVPVFKEDKMEDRMLFFEHLRNRAVRAGDWKLVATGLNGPWELYNLKEDRTEMHNLIDTYPEKAKELSKAWEEWAWRTYVKPFPESIKK